MNDAPVAFRRALRKYLSNNAESFKAVGLLYKVSSFGPRLYFLFGETDAAVGVFTTHIDDILGCGMHGVLDCTRKFPGQRFGPLELQESEFAQVGMELSQGSDFSVRLTQSAFTEGLLPLDASPSLWANRQRPLWG